eukprot:1158867-Pelagomonas_calceolata.AAC.6
MLVQATAEIYNTVTAQLLPTPSKSHYVFNLRDFSRIPCIVLLSLPNSFDQRSAFLYHTQACFLLFPGMFTPVPYWVIQGVQMQNPAALAASAQQARCSLPHQHMKLWCHECREIGHHYFQSMYMPVLQNVLVQHPAKSCARVRANKMFSVFPICSYFHFANQCPCFLARGARL